MLGEEYSALNLALVGMGTVFCCLIVLYGFFWATGQIAARYRGRREEDRLEAMAGPPAMAAPAEGIPEEVVAAIALALAQVRPASCIGAAAGAAEVRVSAAGLPWREQGRLLQHQRSRDWEQR